MTEFHVPVRRTSIAIATVAVEARSLEEAKIEALEKAESLPFEDEVIDIEVLRGVAVEGITGPYRPTSS